MYYNFPSCNLVPLEAEQNDFGVGRQTSVSKETSMTFTSLLTIFRPSYISLFVSFPAIIIRLALLCQVFSVSGPVLCDHASALLCVCVCVRMGAYTLR